MDSPFLQYLSWYVAISVLGWITFPLAFRMLPGLADRGYTLARALGWLIWGYVFWLLASLQILENQLGGQIIALVLLCGISIWALRSFGLRELFSWMRENKNMIFVAELVFFIAFGFWTYIRATDPSILYTEKPMEIAFINGILQSPSFPPSDPWLSGYAISYYYFGYVLVAMLIRVTGVAPEVGFNLAIALLFGLTAIGAYGLVYNLLRNRRSVSQGNGMVGLPVLGPIFILLAGNLEGLLEVLHSAGLFWQQTAQGLQSRFWTWLNILDLTSPPSQPFSLEPHRYTGSILWRASRVLSDYQLDGSFREVIDEFPFFSYQLADLHPHVLAMPFTLLVIALAMHFFIDRRRPGFSVWGIWIPMDQPTLLLSMLALGALGFLNTWDFPIYLVLFAGAYALIRLKESGLSWQRLGDFLTLAIVLGLGGILLYLPFYIGFASQARGFLPSIIFFTRGPHFWIMFAPLLIPIIAYLIFLIRRNRAEFDGWSGLKIGLLLIGGLWLLSYLFAYVITLIPEARTAFLNNQIGALNIGIGGLLQAATLDRLRSPGTWLTLLGIFALVVGLVIHARNRVTLSESDVLVGPEARENEGRKSPADEFSLLLVLLGTLLAIAPEFFYLWDVFGARMNTIFKFYYQVWLVWGVIAAYGMSVLLLEIRKGTGRFLFSAGSVALILVSLINTGLIIKERFPYSGKLSLDGLQSLSSALGEDEIAAIEWLRQEPYGVLAEAVGGSYDSYSNGWLASARISRYTGYPTVLGWPGHEGQWGRDYDLILPRQSDIELLYSTSSWEEANQILQQYKIRYVYIGNSERSIYQVNEKKFDDHLVPVFQYGAVTIYEVPGFESATAAVK